MLLSLFVLSALALSLMLSTTTETMITSHYRDSVEALHAADAGLERALQDLFTAPAWDPVLASPDGLRSGAPSGFTSMTLTPVLGDGRQLDLVRASSVLNCPRAASSSSRCTDSQMDLVTAERPWGPNNPRWRLYANGWLADVLPAGAVDSPFHIAVWVADDPAETDGDPGRDGSEVTNPGSGVIRVRAAAFGPRGARRMVEAAVARAPALVDEGEAESATRSGPVVLWWRLLR